MAICLLALGSNLGDREAKLRSAIEVIEASRSVSLHEVSRWYSSLPLGGPGCQGDYLNGAALIETSLEPLAFLDVLQQIEVDHGRQRRNPPGEARWAARTLDLDLLLFGHQILDTPRLTVPHPRMSFRPFVLEPAVEIAGQLRHPTIGRALDQLFHQMGKGADRIAIVGPQETERSWLAGELLAQTGGSLIFPTRHQKQEAASCWPDGQTTWIEVPSGKKAQHESKRPKLTLLLDVPQHGYGPSLQIRTTGQEEQRCEALAAVQAVWPHLCPR